LDFWTFPNERVINYYYTSTAIIIKYYDFNGELFFILYNDNHKNYYRFGYLVYKPKSVV
jgi:hypothetical protein